MSFLTSIFSFLSNLCGWGKQRDAELNSEAMQKNDAAASQQASVDDATKQVSAALAHPEDTKALEELRKKVAK